MKQKTLPFLLCLLLLVTIRANCQETKLTFKDPAPKVITFNPDSISYQKIFEGMKDSVVFYSGVVTVEPEHSGHVHSTEIYEEMIIVLSGQGEVKLKNRESLLLKYGHIAFIPPETEHQVFNTGNQNLKYIYVAVRAK